MDSYTITIAPNDDSGAATRLVVDTTGDQVRITDVHLHAPQGLSSGHIPTVDFDLLLQAVTGTGTASGGQGVAPATPLTAAQPGTPALEAAAPPDEQPAPVASRRRASKATPRAATATRRAGARTAAAMPQEAATTPRRSARAATTSTTRNAEQTPRATARKSAKTKTPPAPAKKQTVTRAKSPAKSEAPAKRARAAARTAPSTGTGRVYRRTPDDLAAVFQQVGTVAGIAAHYDVPRYTAQGWVSRLRAAA